MRLAVAALAAGAMLALTGCRGDSMDQACHRQYQTQYELRGTPSDIGEAAYVAQCLRDSGQ